MNTRAESGLDPEYAAKQPSRHLRPQSRFDVARIMSSIRSFAGVSEALRVLGAAVVLASMSLFVLQDWNDVNDVNRYLMLLAQTGLLAGAGFALSHGLKEAKGARVFFGLALVSVPANFAILGALLYSVFQWDSWLKPIQDFATWQVDSIASLGITLAGAAAVLVPVTLFGFAVMARHSTKRLALSSFALNSMLLLPIRSSITVSVVALLGVIYALYVVKTATAKDRALKTPEGRFALTTLFIPAGIMLFRSMYFYQVETVMIAMLSMGAFLAARQAAMVADQTPRVTLGLELLSLPLAFTFAVTITDTFAPVVTWAPTAPLFAVAYSALALDVMRRTDSDRLSKGIGITVSLFTALSFLSAAVFEPTAITAFLCIVAGVVMLMTGLTVRNGTASVAGAFTAIGGIVSGFGSILELIANSSWVDLALFGAGAIVIASVLDRHGAATKLYFVKWFGSIGRRKQEASLDD